MPSNPSQSVLPRYSAGSLNSVRNHHGLWKGLSAGMGALEKLNPTGWLTPGAERRFVPKYGSGETRAATSALKTVVGRVAGCQAVRRNPGVESAAPLSCTSAEDWIAQFCRSSIFDSGAAAATCVSQAARTSEQQRIGKYPPQKEIPV